MLARRVPCLEYKKRLMGRIRRKKRISAIPARIVASPNFADQHNIVYLPRKLFTQAQ